MRSWKHGSNKLKIVNQNLIAKDVGWSPKVRSIPDFLVLLSCWLLVMCRIAFQGWLMTLPRGKIRSWWGVQKIQLVSTKIGAKTNLATFSNPYIPKMNLKTEYIIHHLSIMSVFKWFGLEKPRSVQKFNHSGSDRLSVVNLESWWVTYLPKALFLVVNEQSSCSPKLPKVRVSLNFKISKFRLPGWFLENC